MKRTEIKTTKNNYLFTIENVGVISSKGENVFYALDKLREKNLISIKSKIVSAFQRISKSKLVDITTILV
jgi:hypothetical protein